MAQVGVTINGRNYKVACDDGQEEHLEKLGVYVDERVKDLTNAVGQIGDSRLLVMASLMIADELADAQRRAQEFGSETAAQTGLPSSSSVEGAVAEGLDAMAERIEGIADRLEQA